MVFPSCMKVLVFRSTFPVYRSVRGDYFNSTCIAPNRYDWLIRERYPAFEIDGADRQVANRTKYQRPEQGGGFAIIQSKPVFQNVP